VQKLASDSLLINNQPALGELVIERDVQYVSSLSCMRPDKSWTHVDRSGHFHAFDENEKLPTLAVRTVHVGCDGDCGYDNCEGYTDTEHLCQICGVVVKPKYVDRGAERTALPGLATWRVDAQLTSRLGAQLMDEKVSVRLIGDAGEFFGVALVASVWPTAQGDAKARLVGVGPLGRRRKPPRCTCPLLDVSVSWDKPSFALGDPTDCAKHGVGRRAAIAAAVARARGEEPNPLGAL
jgi:hypothetical protein